MDDSRNISVANVRAMASITDEGPTAGSIAQFAYPTSALLIFLALRSICLYSSHCSLPRLEDAVVKRSILLGLVALIIGTYAASSINIFIRSVTGAGAGIDKDKEYYLLFASIIWAFEILFWPRSKDYIWYPYLVSSFICVLGEVIILESALSSSLEFDRFDLISFNLQCLRIGALLLLPAIFLGQKLSKSAANNDDPERQSLLANSDSPRSSSTEEIRSTSNGHGYGSLGKQVAIRDYAHNKSTDGTRSSTSENTGTQRRNPMSEAVERILVIEDGQVVAFGTPQDIVRAVSGDSAIVPILASIDDTIDATEKIRKAATPITKDTSAKTSRECKSLVSVREAAASINAGKPAASSSQKPASRSSTPSKKVPAPVRTKDGASITGSAQAYAHSHSVSHHDRPEMTMASVTPVTIRQVAPKTYSSQDNIDTPITTQKDASTKPDSTTPITIRKASLRRDHSPSKSVHASTSSAKLNADVPEFVPRSLRNSTATEVSACSRAHTPAPLSREGSHSSSPSKINVAAPEFIPRHLRTSTDTSSGSGPHSPSLISAQFNRPISPLKLYEARVASPVRIGSPKPPLPDFNGSTNLNGDNGSASYGHPMGHSRYAMGAVTGNASSRPSPVQTQTETPLPTPPLSKMHLNRYGRRDMAKSEPTSNSQMSSSHDSAQDSGQSGQGSSAETTLIKKAAPIMSQNHRRATAPSDPPSGVESPKVKSIGRAINKPTRRSRHWRANRKLRSRSGNGLSAADMASESSMGSSVAGSVEHQGSVPRAPVTSPSVGPVPGYACTGMN